MRASNRITASPETLADPHAGKRIALISAHGSPLARLGGRETGGMNVYIGEAARALANLGFTVDIFTRRKDPDTPDLTQLAPGVRVIQITAGPAADFDKNEVYWRLTEFVLNVRQFCDREGARYDLIFSHYWLSGWASVLLQSRWQVPHVTMFHTTGRVKNQARVGTRETPLRIETERKIAARVDRIIAASPNDQHQLSQHYPAAAGKITVVPGGVDLDLFRPGDAQAARAALGLGDEPIILFVGRPDPVKGLEILIDAVAELEERTRVKLLVVGSEDREAQAAYRRRALARGIGDQIRFEGAQPRHRMPCYYQAADVCVVPSYVETFGLVAVEALACGTPVIASRVGGLTFTVQDGRTGFLVPWRCAGPFAERLELLLANPELRARFAAAARLSVERFAWPQVARELACVFADVQCAAHESPELAAGDYFYRVPTVAFSCHEYGF